MSDHGDPPQTNNAKIFEIDIATKSISVLVSGLPLSSPDRMLVGDGRPLVGNDLILSDHNTDETRPCCDGRVFRINRQTGAITVLARGNPAFPPPGDPFGLALGPGGDFGTGLYVMDFEGASPNPPVLYRINDDGTQSVFLINATLWNTDRSPGDLAFGNGGGFGFDLYVGDASRLGGNQTIWRVTPQGDLTVFIDPKNIGFPLLPRFGPGGDFGTDLFVLGGFSGIVTVNSDGKISPFAKPLFSLPGKTDMVFSPNGQSLFVSSAKDVIIEIFSCTRFQEQIEPIIDQVETLVATGALTQGQGNSLIAKLNAALEKVCSNNLDLATNQLEAFKNEVGAFITSGVLSPEEGQALIDAANDLIDQISSNVPKRSIAVDHTPNAIQPMAFRLEQNYPNPFNPETEIRFQLPEANHVAVRIFNALGQEIRTLTDSPYEAGFHTVRWDGQDNNGNDVASGVYLYKLQAGIFSQTKKMSLLR